MKKYIIFLVLIAFSNIIAAQSQKDKVQLTQSINQIIDGFNQKNEDKINQFVNKDLGIGVIFKNENQYGYLNLQDMDFSLTFPTQIKYWTIPTHLPVQFTRTPGYNTQKKTWSSYGLFCQIDSPIVLFYIDEFMEQYQSDFSEQSLFKANENTEDVAFVVLADKKGKGLQFVLTKINQKWTLTFFDLSNL